MSTLQCHACKKSFEWDLPSHPIGRLDNCPHCYADLKACLNCAHYDSSSQWECRESISEAVLEKSKANFCGEFQYSTNVSGSGNIKSAAGKEDLLKQAEALFKKK
jgi:hypothetical protein